MFQMDELSEPEMGFILISSVMFPYRKDKSGARKLVVTAVLINLEYEASSILAPRTILAPLVQR